MALFSKADSTIEMWDWNFVTFHEILKGLQHKSWRAGYKRNTVLYGTKKLKSGKSRCFEALICLTVSLQNSQKLWIKQPTHLRNNWRWKKEGEKDCCGFHFCSNSHETWAFYTQLYAQSIYQFIALFPWLRQWRSLYSSHPFALKHYQ